MTPAVSVTATALLFARIAIQGLWPDRLLPTTFIFIAPPAVVGVAAMQMDAPMPLVWMLYGMALFTTLWVGTLGRRIASLPFGLPRHVHGLEAPADVGVAGEGAEAGAKGALYIIKPGDQPQILQHVELEGRCFGTPVAYNGKLYLQTTKHLYCWGQPGNNPGLPEATAADASAAKTPPKLTAAAPTWHVT